jgi:hypothetical protein
MTEQEVKERFAKARGIPVEQVRFNLSLIERSGVLKDVKITEDNVYLMFKLTPRCNGFEPNEIRYRVNLSKVGQVDCSFWYPTMERVDNAPLCMGEEGLQAEIMRAIGSADINFLLTLLYNAHKW